MRGTLVAVVLVVVLLQALSVGILMGTHSFGSSTSLSALSTNLQKVQSLPSPTAQTLLRRVKATPTPSPTPHLLPSGPSSYIANYDPASMHFAVSGNTVYAISDNGSAILWTYTADNAIAQSPLVTDNAIYAVTDRGHIYALQLTNGALLWSYATHTSPSSPLTIENGVIIMYADNGTIYRFSASSGNLLDAVKPVPEVTPTPGITPTPQDTPTPMPTPGVTPTPQDTPTPMPTPGVTPTPQDTPMPMPVPTATPDTTSQGTQSAL